MTSRALNESERKVVMDSIRHALLAVAPEWTNADAVARPGGLRALEEKLDALVAIARRTRSDRVEPYLAEILEEVCSRCDNQQNSGYCPLRHARACALYASAGPIMWAIGGALRRLGDPGYVALHGDDLHTAMTCPPARTECPARYWTQYDEVQPCRRERSIEGNGAASSMTSAVAITAGRCRWRCSART